MHMELDDSSNSDGVSDKETHLRRRLVEGRPVETMGQSHESQSPPKSQKSVRDPLKWFGLLVPPSLKTAQKNFKEGTCSLQCVLLFISLFIAVEISCQLASTQAKVEHYRNLYFTLIANRS